MKFIFEIALDDDTHTPLDIAELLDTARHQMVNWHADGVTDLREAFADDGGMFYGELQHKEDPTKLFARMAVLEEDIEPRSQFKVDEPVVVAECFGDLQRKEQGRDQLN